MNHQPRATRRDFLRQAAVTSTAAFALPSIVPSHVLGKEGAVSPSATTTLGVIGIGPRCTYDLKAMLGLPDVRCVAIADVQASRRNAGKRLVDQQYGNQDCRLERDFRELLDRKDIDAVLIATGDRWHALASIMAAAAGKDVYSEKPCGLTIAYCQELADTMKRTGRVFQAGTQRRSIANFQQAVQLAHSGKLGKIHTLYASAYTPEINTSWLLYQVAQCHGGQSTGHAPFAYRLSRGCFSVASAAQTQAGPREGKVHRRRRSQRPAVPPGARSVERLVLCRTMILG